jgi:hypothetical protein
MLRCRRCNQFVAMVGVACMVCGDLPTSEFISDKTPGLVAQPYTASPHTPDENIPLEIPRVLVAQLSTEATRPSSSHQWGIGWSSDEYWPSWQPPYPLVLLLASSTS